MGWRSDQLTRCCCCWQRDPRSSVRCADPFFVESHSAAPPALVPGIITRTLVSYALLLLKPPTLEPEPSKVRRVRPVSGRAGGCTLLPLHICTTRARGYRHGSPDRHRDDVGPPAVQAPLHLHERRRASRVLPAGLARGAGGVPGTRPSFESHSRVSVFVRVAEIAVRYPSRTPR